MKDSFKRRDFIKTASLVSSSWLVPNFVKSFPVLSPESGNEGKVLVIIQLSGGNDGLNTVVPYQNDIYYSNRPGINISPDKVIPLTDNMGLHPNLPGLASLYDEGALSIINSVGYPNPNRSHFRSMDIWQTASDANQYLQSGWVGRWLDANCQESCGLPSMAIEIDDSLSLAMKGEKAKGLATNDINRLYRHTRNPFFQALAKQPQPAQNHNHDKVAYLYKTFIETTKSASYLYEKSKVYRSGVLYPRSPFARQLKTIAQLIVANAHTRVYYVSLGGFDTHAGQKWQHARLLKVYSEAMAAFIKDLKRHNRFEDTVSMTFSEFGRRVRQNGSNGTDHGAANNLFIVGGNLKKAGFYNQAPDLTDLDQGDIKHQVDFRQVYATLIDNWLGYDSRKVLSTRFNPLNFV